MKIELFETASMFGVNAWALRYHLDRLVRPGRIAERTSSGRYSRRERIYKVSRRRLRSALRRARSMSSHPVLSSRVDVLRNEFLQEVYSGDLNKAYGMRLRGREGSLVRHYSDALRERGFVS